MMLDDKGRCPNCLRKPLTYRRGGHYFCHTCCRQFSMEDRKQQKNWAWDFVDGKWKPTYPDDGQPDHYMHAKPTSAARRRFNQQDTRK